MPHSLTEANLARHTKETEAERQLVARSLTEENLAKHIRELEALSDHSFSRIADFTGGQRAQRVEPGTRGCSIADKSWSSAAEKFLRPSNRGSSWSGFYDWDAGPRPSRPMPRYGGQESDEQDRDSEPAIWTFSSTGSICLEHIVPETVKGGKKWKAGRCVVC